jgi:hypothetical protein
MQTTEESEHRTSRRSFWRGAITSLELSPESAEGYRAAAPSCEVLWCER